MFLPITRKEMDDLGWDSCDVILVTGDTYIDSPYFGTALIGKVLLNAGYRVGIIPQPDPAGDDIARLGEPRLFWGVSSGCVDSMVSNYTPMQKRRMQDDLTPGGVNSRRPDRALIAYTSLIRSRFKNTAPVVLGGIDASLRRIAHYDCWDNKVRRSILFDSKADILMYGMGERSIVELAAALCSRDDWRSIRGISYAAKEPAADYIMLPPYEQCAQDKDLFTEMFRLFYDNCDAIPARGLVQKHADRYLIQNPPQYPLSSGELDESYALDFEYDAHPLCKAQGEIRALDTIRFS
ncbi:MAG: YgiQ family radical SAM protein, partial [Spirochaetota bacterium]